jgi:NitT/TauT family transport system substrate-binding protein
MNRKNLIWSVTVSAIALATPALALDEIALGISWKAQVEMGGYYQAVATGIYEKNGLKVTIFQGGPQVNQRQFLINGKRDFILEPSIYSALHYPREGIPMVAVAGIFQRSPQGLMAHPDNPEIKTLSDIAGKPVMVANSMRETYWYFLKTKYGFTDNQIRPYTFNLAPFLADKKAIQQVYATSEPYSVRTNAGFEPKVFLLSDFGYEDYAQMLVTSQKLVREKPDLVQRFVNASIEGWYSLLYGDPTPAFAGIKRDNPDQTQDLMEFARKAVKDLKIIDDGDAKTMGIGAMTDARWERVTKAATDSGFFPTGKDYKAAYTLRFVNKKHGMNAQ